MLQVLDLVTGYDKQQVLQGLTLRVHPGEIAGMVGPNGAGKSTALKAIFGLLPVWSGKIVYKGREIQNRSPIQNVHDGLTFCPQGNRVFDELTVEENLEIGGYLYRQRTLLEARKQEIFELFPILKERRSQLAGLLSGGEKQMLALGRALMLKPTLLLLDEPSLGLSPNLVKKALHFVKEINRRWDITFLIVEQKVHEILEIADRIFVLKDGRAVWETKTDGLQSEELKRFYLPPSRELK